LLSHDQKAKSISRLAVAKRVRCAPRAQDSAFGSSLPSHLLVGARNIAIRGGTRKRSPLVSAMASAKKDEDIGFTFASDKPKRLPKGHRQKGAGTIAVDKGPQERDGVIVQSWQRMPMQLIQEHCQKQKRPRPQLHPTAPAAGKQRFRIVLPDPKNNTKDMHFCPIESFDTAAVAKEHAALLALLHVQGTLPLERKLPEPYRTTWIESQAAAKAAAGGGGKAGKRKAAAAPAAANGSAAVGDRASAAPKLPAAKSASAAPAAGTASSSSSAIAATVTGAAAEALPAAPSLGDSMWGTATASLSSEGGGGEEKRLPPPPAAVVLVADRKFASKYDQDKARAEHQKIANERKRKAAACESRDAEMSLMMGERMRA
ncbi:unnamed protein product, partial [Phaeothamnion confervicola]